MSALLLNPPVHSVLIDLPGQVAELEPKSVVAVRFRDGSTRLGSFGLTEGLPWVQVQGGDTLLLAPSGGDLERIEAIEVLKAGSEVHQEQLARKFGKIAYSQPVTREQFETTLWELAADVEASRPALHRAGDLAVFRRHMELAAQFERMADEVELAKTKRNYLLANAARRRQGMPLRRANEGVTSVADCPRQSVPKPSDFDPDREIRRKRRPRPAMDYESRAEVENSLSRALRDLATRRLSKAKRQMYERIVVKRRQQLSSGDYYEAVRERQGKLPEQTPGQV